MKSIIVVNITTIIVFFVILSISVESIIVVSASASPICGYNYSSSTDAAIFTLGVYNNTTLTETTTSINSKLKSLLGFSQQQQNNNNAFQVSSTNNNNNQQQPCLGKNSSTCNFFTIQVSQQQNQIATIGNRVNYSSVAVEAFLSQLYRNSSSPNEFSIQETETLDSFGWDSINVQKSSCATQNVKNILAQKDSSLLVFPPSSSSSTSPIPILDSCQDFFVEGTGCTEKATINAILSALSLATTPSSSSVDNDGTKQSVFEFMSPMQAAVIGIAPANSGNTCGSFYNYNVSMVAMLRRNNNKTQTAISNALNALVWRSQETKINLETSLKFVPANKNDSSCRNPYLRNLNQNKNNQNVFFSDKIPASALVVPFSCYNTIASSNNNKNNNNPSSASSSSNFYEAGNYSQLTSNNIQYSDADNVTNILVSNFPYLFSFSPNFFSSSASASSSKNNNNNKILINNSVTITNAVNSSKMNVRLCGILLFTSPTNTSAISQVSSCTQQWSSRVDAASFLNNQQQKTKKTPALMVYSLIITAVLWIVVWIYVYKFAPKERRYDFPHHGSEIAEAMLGAEDRSLLENETSGEDDSENNNNNSSSTTSKRREAADAGVVEHKEFELQTQNKVFSM